MNFFSWLVLGVVLACTSLAVLYLTRHKNESDCSGNCAECGACGKSPHCNKKQ